LKWIFMGAMVAVARVPPAASWPSCLRDMRLCGPFPQTQLRTSHRFMRNSPR
ncbi:mCG1050069, partial [Mus musculus]